MSTVVAPVVVRQSDPSETSSSTSTRSDAFSNANVSTLLAALAPKAIVVYGVAADFCDRYRRGTAAGDLSPILAGYLPPDV